MRGGMDIETSYVLLTRCVRAIRCARGRPRAFLKITINAPTSGKWWAAVTLVQDLHALELVGWPAKLGPRGHFRPSKGRGGVSQNVDLAAYHVGKIPLILCV